MNSKEMLKPVLVLTLICFIVTAALVVTYQFTAPQIATAKAAAADASRREVLPQAEEFAPLELPAGLDPQVLEISRGISAGQTVGWVISCGSKGYGGTVMVMCGLDGQGALTKVKITEHTETPGLGSKVADSAYTDLYSGADISSYTQIDGVSGATITSKALKAAIAAAYSAYGQIKEAV